MIPNRVSVTSPKHNIRQATDTTTNERPILQARHRTITAVSSDLDQDDLDRLGDLLSVYWTYHLPPRNYPKILDDEHPLHIVVNRLDSENEETTLEAVRLLVKFGTDVNTRDRKGQTALHRLLGRLTPDKQQTTFTLMVQLLENGLDPNALDQQGESVLHVVINRLNSKNVETI